MSEAGPPRVFATPAALLEAVGTQLGPTAWLLIDQPMVDGFATVTRDHQWIHVDPVRAADGPFGGTIAHGYLTLSLVNALLPELLDVQGFAHAVNVGADKLRFLNPVRVGKRIRARGEIIAASPEKGGIQSVVRVTVEIEDADRPACVVDTISRYFPAD
jgi:acyl dehydratase